MLQGQLSIVPFNYIDVVLIPKNDHPTNLADFRPISLCNTIYKIVTKVLAERLNKVLPMIISENQDAFLKSRNASDIALIGLEIMHQIVKPSKSNTHRQNIALKIDLSKVFDKIEWPYLFPIVQKLNPPPSPNFHLIHQCLITSKIYIRYNHTKTPYFNPTR